MLGHPLRRWPSIGPTLGQRLSFQSIRGLISHPFFSLYSRLCSQAPPALWPPVSECQRGSVWMKTPPSPRPPAGQPRSTVSPGRNAPDLPSSPLPLPRDLTRLTLTSRHRARLYETAVGRS